MNAARAQLQAQMSGLGVMNGPQPALLGGLLGGIGRGVRGAVGGIIREFTGRGDAPTAGPGGVPIPTPQQAPYTPPIQINPPFAGPPGVGVNVTPRFPIGLMPSSPQMPTTMGADGAPKGYRLNKTSYFLRDGTFVPKGTKWVRVRRRNPLNPRALSRSISRISSAKKAANKLGRITIRKASCR